MTQNLIERLTDHGFRGMNYTKIDSRIKCPDMICINSTKSCMDGTKKTKAIWEYFMQ